MTKEGGQFVSMKAWLPCVQCVYQWSPLTHQCVYQWSPLTHQCVPSFIWSLLCTQQPHCAPRTKLNSADPTWQIHRIRECIHHEHLNYKRQAHAARDWGCVWEGVWDGSVWVNLGGGDQCVFVIWICLLHDVGNLEGREAIFSAPLLLIQHAQHCATCTKCSIISIGKEVEVGYNSLRILVSGPGAKTHLFIIAACISSSH